MTLHHPVNEPRSKTRGTEDTAAGGVTSLLHSSPPPRLGPKLIPTTSCNTKPRNPPKLEEYEVNICYGRSIANIKRGKFPRGTPVGS